MQNTTKEDLLTFYLRLIRETAIGIQKQVCDKNGISLQPTTAAELRPIPVYESDAPHSLLTSANLRTPTTIQWATNQGFSYLPAYFKKYRQDGRLRNEIVVIADNYCVARFFAAKELMHCFIDDDGHPASNTIPLVKDLIESLAVGLSNVHALTDQHIVDEIAWVGAVEYLLPESWVPMLLKALESLEKNAPKANAYLHLAQLIRVPETVLRVRLRQFRK